MSRVIRRRRILRARPGGAATPREDVLAVEEPLEIRVRGDDRPQEPPALTVVTMRTPGDDFDLVAGFLVGEGLVHRADELTTMRYCPGADVDGRQSYNVVEAHLAPGTPLPDPLTQRQTLTTSACGLCGTTSIEAVAKASRLADPSDPVVVDGDVLLALPERLRDDQSLFARTGGVHAAGLFDAGGRLHCLREDVGRHNAVDKVVGWALREGRLPLHGAILQVSGRASYELVQKAHLAGIPVLAAVGAPSSLAVELAESTGMTVAGFSRGSSVNLYSHPERVRLG